MSPRSRGAVMALAFILLPALIAACGKAGSNNEDDLDVPPVATFTIGGTLSGLAADEEIVVRLDHDFRVLEEDDAGILRPTPTVALVDLDASRNGQFYAFDAALPEGAAWRVQVDVQPQRQVCQVSRRDGAMPDDDVVDVDIVCSETVIGQPALNDTGIDWCSDTVHRNRAGTAAERQLGCDGTALEWPGQDGDLGRDALARQDAINATNTLGKTGAGEAGFDFTKVSNSGAVLAPGAVLGAGPANWACTRDNVTGLVWEVKVDDAARLRHRDWTYSWFSSAGVNDGGSPGSESGGTCLDAARCDTEKYVADVNAAGLCGANDWRMPTREELRSIMHYGRPAPAIDPVYFPDTGALHFFWTGASYAGDPGIAGDVGVGNAAWTFAADGGSGIGYKTTALRVRLVRGGP